MNLALLLGGGLALWWYLNRNATPTSGTLEGQITGTVIPQVQTGLIAPYVPSGIDVPPSNPILSSGIGPAPVIGAQSTLQPLPALVSDISTPRIPQMEAQPAVLQNPPVFQPMIRAPHVNTNLAKLRDELITNLQWFAGEPNGNYLVRNGEIWDSPSQFNYALSLVPDFANATDAERGGPGGGYLPPLTQLWPNNPFAKGAPISLSEYWSKAAPWLQSYFGLSGWHL